MDRSELTDVEIAAWRLQSQRLAGSKATNGVEVVRGLLGVQAENHAQASWAISTRANEASRTALAAQFDAGAYLRTHVLRTTWHYVLPDDIGWLLELTGPRVRRLMGTQQRELGVDDRMLDEAAGHIAGALAGGNHLTRQQLGERIGAEGLPSEGRGLTVVCAHAELTGVICSGALVDGQHTYALLSERAPDARRLDHDEALAELVLRYFTGHGPATERDLAYWATMTLTDVRAGLSSVADRLDSFDHGGRTYWFGEAAPTAPPQPRAHLLQILDEYFRGYQDSRWVLDTGQLVDRERESSIGMVILDGQFVGGMRRTINRDQVLFDVELRRELDLDEQTALDDAADRYGVFLGLEPVVRTTAK